MINLAVINLKDIIKLLIKIIVIITVLTILIKFFNLIKFNEIKKFISSYAFVECMNSEIAVLNYEKATDNKNNNILSTQFALFGYVKNNKNQYEQEVAESLGEAKEQTIDENQYEQVETHVVEENNIPSKVTDKYQNVAIKNESDYSLTEEILKPDSTISNCKDILIFHTHTCESYTPTEANDYESSGNYRTTDLNYSVARVGTELTNRLTEKRI